MFSRNAWTVSAGKNNVKFQCVVRILIGGIKKTKEGVNL